MSRRRLKRRHKRRNSEAVELNLTAMLDMAFQLLAFFILTFRPDPPEGQLNLRLPPPQPVAVAGARPVGANESVDALAGVESLIISAFATPAGEIESLAVGEGAVGNLRALDARLRAILGEPDMPFEQIVIQVDSRLRYQALMEIVDLCTGLTLADGRKVSKLSFVELPAGQP
ncbi:MAG: biopolymer transporter ExbD [Planctomyces sp.]|nr:biopolymer transporter ExbD [Planctomyces sp.]